MWKFLLVTAVSVCSYEVATTSSLASDEFNSATPKTPKIKYSE